MDQCLSSGAAAGGCFVVEVNENKNDAASLEGIIGNAEVEYGVCAHQVINVQVDVNVQEVAKEYLCEVDVDLAARAFDH